MLFYSKDCPTKPIRKLSLALWSESRGVSGNPSASFGVFSCCRPSSGVTERGQREALGGDFALFGLPQPMHGFFSFSFASI